MKSIMMALFVLLLLVPVGGWAGDSSLLVYDIYADSISMLMADKKMVLGLLEKAKIQGDELNIALYEYDEQNQVWNRARPSSCLATMQAAMKSMDEFVPKDIPLTSTTLSVIDWCQFDEVCLAMKELEVAQRRSAAKQQWQAAKKECWK